MSDKAIFRFFDSKETASIFLEYKGCNAVEKMVFTIEQLLQFDSFESFKSFLKDSGMNYFLEKGKPNDFDYKRKSKMDYIFHVDFKSKSIVGICNKQVTEKERELIDTLLMLNEDQLYMQYFGA